MIFAINNVCVKFIVEHILMKNKLSVCSILALVCSFNSYADFETTNTEHLLLTTAHTEIDKYLVIATGSTTNDGFSFDASNVELGADQEVVHSGDGSDTGEINGNYSNTSGGWAGTFITTPANESRWQENDNTGTVGYSDYLEYAKHLVETPDYSGNVAITHDNGSIESENSDYFASLGVHCSDEGCIAGDSEDSSWNKDGTTDAIPDNDASDANGFRNLEADQGVYENFDATVLINELNEWQKEISGLTRDVTIGDIAGVDFGGSKIDNYYSTDKGTLITDLDALDTNGDGFAVIDIDTGKLFEIGNTDWILKTNKNTIAIFRMQTNVTVKINNSSIMMGCSDMSVKNCEDEKVQDLGAIFYTDQVSNSTNTVIDVSDSILGGIGLWDFSRMAANNDDNLNDDKTLINFQNAQGCIQAISEQVIMSNTRFNRCDLANATTPPLEVPEPPVVVLFITGLIMLTAYRKKQIINS
jgi:hypothetical protein